MYKQLNSSFNLFCFCVCDLYGYTYFKHEVGKICTEFSCRMIIKINLIT